MADPVIRDFRGLDCAPSGDRLWQFWQAVTGGAAPFTIHFGAAQWTPAFRNSELHDIVLEQWAGLEPNPGAVRTPTPTPRERPGCLSPPSEAYPLRRSAAERSDDLGAARGRIDGAAFFDTRHGTRSTWRHNRVLFKACGGTKANLSHLQY
jgi:hypothetical protein